MTPATLIREVQADGVRLALSPAGTIKATGDGAAVNRWRDVIREHKAEIVDALRQAANFAPTALSSRDEPRILDWLSRIGETDPVTIGEVIDRCRADGESARVFPRTR